MKSYLNLLVALVCIGASAQNINDVLRYSLEDLQGTPRFQAMGGAFGAVGGDLSALNINPAGVAVFNNSLVSFTGGNYNRKNEAGYFNSVTNSDRNFWDFNQMGGVFVFRNISKNPEWKKTALAFNYDMVQNFDNDIIIRGNSPQGIDNYFLTAAQGVPFGSLLIRDGEFIEDAYLNIGSRLGFLEQQAFLGYYGGLIDPVNENDTNTDYLSNAEYSSVSQDYLLRTSGFNGKFTMALATQYKDQLYLGAAINMHSVLYRQYKEFSERGYDTDSPIQFTNFDNFLRTEGTGFSFSLGAIAKLNENVRIGGSYQSPTWYRLTDDFSQRINSDLADSDIRFIDFNIVNLFPRYRIKTPGKLTGSLALIFGKQGLISFDYSYQNMSNAELRPPSDPSFSAENQFISSELGGVSTFRLGGEYRIAQLSLRAGYRFQGSPFANGGTTNGGIGDLNAYSGGIGYSFGASRLDVALSRSKQEVNQQLFDVGLTTAASVNRINTNVSLGYTINF